MIKSNQRLPLKEQEFETGICTILIKISNSPLKPTKLHGNQIISEWKTKGGTTRICATCTEKRDQPKALRERRLVGETEKKPTTQTAISVANSKLDASIFDLSDHSL